MNRFISTASVALSAASLALLGGCSADANRGVESVKVPTLQVSETPYSVRFNPDGSLTSESADALVSYLGSVNVTYGDRILLDDPATPGADARRAAVAAEVARFGLLVEPGTVPSSATMGANEARVILRRTAITPPDCPDWSRPSNPEFQGATMSNFGCATRSNLSAMIADPNDLVEGQDYSGPSADTSAKAIDTFLKRKPTGTGELENTATTKK